METIVIDELPDILHKIHAEQKEVGETVPPPADTSSISKLKSFCESLGVIISPDYLDFLRVSDGLDFNGTVLYSSGTAHLTEKAAVLSFVELNTLFHKGGNESLILYGETGDELFAYDGKAHLWTILDRGSLSVLEHFQTFDAFFDRVLTRAFES